MKPNLDDLKCEIASKLSAYNDEDTKKLLRELLITIDKSLISQRIQPADLVVVQTKVQNKIGDDYFYCQTVVGTTTDINLHKNSVRIDCGIEVPLEKCKKVLQFQVEGDAIPSDKTKWAFKWASYNGEKVFITNYAPSLQKFVINHKKPDSINKYIYFAEEANETDVTLL